MKCYSRKICLVVLLLAAIAATRTVEAKKKGGNNKYEGDFEFVDEVSCRWKEIGLTI